MTDARARARVDAQALLSWFRANARVLPWREGSPRDPYRTWVSEVMLQQTRVDTVLRYYERFLKAFPDVAALAAADDDALMKRWEGLGYYRRARLLREGARAVVAAGGRIPRTAKELQELPGFGPYTAGAVASLAFGEAVPAVDGNVTRVMARQAAKRAPTREDVEAWVMRHQPRAAAGAFNEALMELGATVCTPRNPNCDACPVSATCRARCVPERYPEKAKRAAVPVVQVALAVARRGDLLLLEKRDSGLLAGTWGLPWVEGGPDALRMHVESLVGAPVEVGPQVAEGAHVFTHRKWAMRAYEVQTVGARGEWRRPEDVALGTAHRRILAAMSGTTMRTLDAFVD